VNEIVKNKRSKFLCRWKIKRDNRLSIIAKHQNKKRKKSYLQESQKPGILHDIFHSCVHIIKEQEKQDPPFIMIEPWRICSFTYKTNGLYFIYFGSPGRRMKNGVEYHDGILSTDNPFQAILYLSAHELAHWMTSLRHGVMKHDDLWREYYSKYVEILEKRIEKPKSAEKLILKELEEFERVRERKIRELLFVTLFMDGKQKLAKKIETCTFDILDKHERKAITEALLKHKTPTTYWESLYIAERIMIGKNPVFHL